MNEIDFIARLRQQAQARQHSTRLTKGIGDDASVIKEAANRDLVVTTDLLVEGIDFYRHATPAGLLGHKALAVSLSDIAAMGARPYWAFLSLGMPRAAWNDSFKDEFTTGFLSLADRFGVTLAGGDVSETKETIVIDSIVLGEVNSGTAVLRSGARVGDQIFVTGNLGGAAAGLKLIQLGARASETEVVATRSADLSEAQAVQALLRRQLRPDPRVGWGMILGEEQLATSMIDLSDGISSDLHHLCKESNVGAIIDAAALPLDDNVRQLCGRRALDPLSLALHGGEDFELLFMVSPEDVSRLPKRVDGVTIARIGEITTNSNVIEVNEKGRRWKLEPQGYEHFSNNA